MSHSMLCKLPPYVFGTDAQGAGEGDLGGFGVVGRYISEEDQHVFMSCGELPGRIVKRLGDYDGARKYDDLTPTVPVTMLPEHLFEQSKWKVLMHGRWLYGDHVTIGESRAVVKLIRRLSHFPQLHGSLITSVQDNAPTAHAMKKGRSASFGLLRVLRQKAATCILCGFQLFLPWARRAET